MSRFNTRTVLGGGQINPGPPTLGALSIPASVTVGAAFAISGATQGSTISATGLPAGWTLDSAGRTITSSDARATTFTLTETLSGATNTGRSSSVSTTSAVVTNTILMETGDRLLNEDGSFLLLEAA